MVTMEKKELQNKTNVNEEDTHNRSNRVLKDFLISFNELPLHF